MDTPFWNVAGVLPTGSEERDVLGVGSSPVAILPSSIYENHYIIMQRKSDHNTPLGHHTDHGPVGLDQYNSLGQYYDPHTASRVSYLGKLITVKY